MAVSDYQALIDKHAAAFQLPAAWIKAIMMKESSGIPTAYRAEPKINDASYGLMQLLYGTARGLGYAGTKEGLYDPDTNIYLGSKLIAQHRAAYGDDIQRIYSAYISGRPDKYLTDAYVSQQVAKVVDFVYDFLKEEPLIATAGAGGGLLIVVLLWLWAKKRK